MLKNSEVKKLYIVLIIFFFVFLFFSIVVTKININNYKKYFLDYNAKVINTIRNNYPDTTDKIIDLIINGDADKKILEKYGIDDNDSINKINNLNTEYKGMLKINVIFFISIFTVFIIIISLYIRKIYKRINNLNNYTDSILENKTQLDIVDNSEGEISILKNNLYDITRLLKENNSLLEKEKEYLKTALADISHQIRTPLTSLYLYNEILYKEKDEKKIKQFLDKEKVELERIEWLITSLLKLSKIDSGTIVFKDEKINVINLIKSVHQDLDSLIKDKKISLNILNDEDIYINGDFNWLKEALINIVKNCTEHVPIKGIIDISYEDNPLYTLITIKDNGEGIDKEDIRHIFERFYKAKNSNKNSIGIGLSLSKSIINKHNGDISVKSKKGEFTSFEIKLYKKII